MGSSCLAVFLKESADIFPGRGEPAGVGFAGGAGSFEELRMGSNQRETPVGARGEVGQNRFARLQTACGNEGKSRVAVNVIELMKQSFFCAHIGIDFSHVAGENAVVFPSEKDFTDGELAMEELLKRDVSFIEIYGGGGGREDHFFGNVALLVKARLNGKNAFFITDYSEFHKLPSE